MQNIKSKIITLALASIFLITGLWQEPSLGETPPSLCDVILATGKRFKTVAAVPDPDVANGVRLIAELANQDEWYAEGYGFQPYVTQLPKLSNQLGIGALAPRPNSPAANEEARPGNATGYRFFYPEVWTLNIRMDQLDTDGQIPVRFQSVHGILSSLEVLLLLANLRMPYGLDGSSHYHDLQVHLFGVIAVPKFWWEGVRGRAQFIAAIANIESFMRDPVLNESVLAMAHGLTHDVEYVTSDFPKGVMNTLSGMSTPRSDTQRAQALYDLLQMGGTGANFPTMGTRSLAQNFFKTIDRAEKNMDRKIDRAIKQKLSQFIAAMELTEDPIFPEPMEILRQARANLKISPSAETF